MLVGKDARVEGYRAFNDKGDIIEQKGYDENGNEIPNYIFMQEASFPGGIKLWQMYLIGNLNQNIPVKNGAPVRTYRVVVSFLVNKEGNVTEAKAENDPGFGMAEEAVRVISKSPQWNPAFMYNKAVTYRQKQGVVFNVTK
ncbi:MAG: energy transducer TonB [Arachidicoccus sp.]|nr:energy transducer TonB [Arachidicoccus sp.]